MSLQNGKNNRIPHSLIVDWDREEDTIYIIKKDIAPESTITKEVNFDVLIRYDRQENIVGVEIEEFSRHLPDFQDMTEDEIAANFEQAMELLNNRVSVMDAARQLVPA